MHRAPAPMLHTACGFRPIAPPHALSDPRETRGAARVRLFRWIWRGVFATMACRTPRPRGYNLGGCRDPDVAERQIDEEQQIGIECRQATPTLA
jgi:hypothetical protein